MPIHDWSRVDSGVFHDFHQAWNVQLSRELNCGLLPSDHYSMIERVTGDWDSGLPPRDPRRDAGPNGAMAIAHAPPKARVVAKAEVDFYTVRRRRLAIRHEVGDRLVAMIEIVPPGIKASRYALRDALTQAEDVLAQGYHLLLIDLQPPTTRDPRGIHGALWERFSEEPYVAPPDKPLTLAAYTGGPPITAYVEPVAVGDELADMPLFLDPYSYVNVPLEATYRAAWRGVPGRWKDVLEPPAG